MKLWCLFEFKDFIIFVKNVNICFILCAVFCKRKFYMMFDFVHHMSWRFYISSSVCQYMLIAILQWMILPPLVLRN